MISGILPDGKDEKYIPSSEHNMTRHDDIKEHVLGRVRIFCVVGVGWVGRGLK